MKTVIVSAHHYPKIRSLAAKIRVPLIALSMRDIMVMTWASLLAVATITLFVWAAGAEVNRYFGVSTWGLGFIFLALALDTHARIAWYQLATGIALLVLAMLQSLVSPGFMIIAGLILAAWLAVLLFKRFSA